MSKRLFLFYSEQEKMILFFFDFELPNAIASFIKALTSSKTLRQITEEQTKKHGARFYFDGDTSIKEFLKANVRGTQFFYDSETDSWETNTDEILVESERYNYK